MDKNDQALIAQTSHQIVGRYKNSKNVLGILLVGSAARGMYDQYSDIDFVILLAKRGKHRRRKFPIGLKVEVEILFNTLKEAQQYLNDERRSIHRATSHMFADGRILYQTTPVIRQLQRLAQKNLGGKTGASHADIVMHKYSLDDFLSDARRDAARKDILAFHLDSHLLIQNAVELLLKLCGDFYRKPKEMTALLKRLDRRFVLLLKDFYTAHSLPTKLKRLKRISAFVLKKSGGGLPSHWTL